MITVNNSEELKKALEGGYSYITFGSDITLTEGININTQKRVTIDGMNHNYIGINSNTQTTTIIANKNNKTIIIKNMNITHTNTHGIVYVRGNHEYDNIEIIYENITFNGPQLAYNPFGKIKIIDSYIEINPNNNIPAQEVAECNQIKIGGNTTIINNTTIYSLFKFRNDTFDPYITILPGSLVNITSPNTELISNTNNLKFTIMVLATLNLTCKNGFGYDASCSNVLIDEFATFTFIENGHYNTPMWQINESLIINEGANVKIINNYNNTPNDNYNIKFGDEALFIVNNPNILILYNKNADVIYGNNLNYKLSFTRINLWDDSKELSNAGNINDLPTYSFYEDNYIDNNSKPDNFNLLNKKQISIGNINTNIYTTDSKIEGYTIPNAEISINNNIISSDDNGFFSFAKDNDINIIINKDFIYKERNITLPYEGELTLFNCNNLEFALEPISLNPVILKRKNDLEITVIDSRVNKNKWSILANTSNDLIKFNNNLLNNSIIYEGENNLITKIIFDKDKNILLNLENSYLEANKFYYDKIYFTIKTENT